MLEMLGGYQRGLQELEGERDERRKFRFGNGGCQE